MNKVCAFLVGLLMAGVPVFAQDQPSANDIVGEMQHDLNLSGDQVAKITQVVERYTNASSDLQKSIDAGTMNPSAIDSQKQQIKDAEEQGIAQYLRPDQLTEWRSIEGQMDQPGENDNDSDTGSDKYSNLPNNKPGQ